MNTKRDFQKTSAILPGSGAARFLVLLLALSTVALSLPAQPTNAAAEKPRITEAAFLTLFKSGRGATTQLLNLRRNFSGASCVRLRISCLEVQLHPQLHDARIASRGHLVEQRGDHVGRATANRIGVVEGVKGFPTELSVEALRELDVL